MDYCGLQLLQKSITSLKPAIVIIVSVSYLCLTCLLSGHLQLWPGMSLKITITFTALKQTLQHCTLRHLISILINVGNMELD